MSTTTSHRLVVVDKKRVIDMAQEDDFVSYKDISELKKEFEGMKSKKDISIKDIHDAVQKLSQIMTDMLKIIGAAAEQMKLEEKEYESDAKRHEMILSKLDKIIDQNKTIAEGMVAIVEMVKEKLVTPEKEREESIFKPKPFMQRQQIKMQPPPIPQAMPSTGFGMQMQMPPMQPAPPPDLPDLEFPEEPFPIEAEQKKKSLFGMFKK